MNVISEESDVTWVNNILVEYIQSLHDRQKAFYLSRNTELAVQLVHRVFYRRLRTAWDSVGSWESQIVSAPRIPLTLDIVMAMFIQSVIFGMVHSPKDSIQWFAFGVGCVCAFKGLLRPSEWCKVRVSHVSFLSAEKGEFILALDAPKNRKTMGSWQITIIQCRVAYRWLSWLILNVSENEFVFQGGYPRFKQFFSKILDSLNLQDIGYTPGSLRAGGATSRFIDGMEIARLKFLGRWKSLNSLEHYIQQATASLARHKVAPEVNSAISLLLKQGRGLRQPPSGPWELFGARRVVRCPTSTPRPSAYMLKLLPKSVSPQDHAPGSASETSDSSPRTCYQNLGGGNQRTKPRLDSSSGRACLNLQPSS